MPMDTPGEVAVVRLAYRIEEAYSMGHDEFSEVEADSAEDVEFSYFTDSARWANVVLPRLRAMSGYGHRGRGSSHTVQRQVAVIHSGCEEDEPAEADLRECFRILDAMIDAYRMGAIDAAVGTPPHPEAALHDAGL